MTVIQKRVHEGAKLLDDYLPGWAEKINQDTFRMSSCHACALGQLFGEYLDGLHELFEPEAEDELAMRYGFEADFLSGPRSDGGIDLEYTQLQLAWVEEIEARLAATEEA